MLMEWCVSNGKRANGVLSQLVDASDSLLNMHQNINKTLTAPTIKRECEHNETRPQPVPCTPFANVCFKNLQANQFSASSQYSTPHSLK